MGPAQVGKDAGGAGGGKGGGGLRVGKDSGGAQGGKDAGGAGGGKGSGGAQGGKDAGGAGGAPARPGGTSPRPGLVAPARYVRQVRQELARVVWPTRKETAIATGMVLVMVTISAVFFLVVDQLFSYGVRILLGRGA